MAFPPLHQRPVRTARRSPARSPNLRSTYTCDRDSMAAAQASEPPTMQLPDKNQLHPPNADEKLMNQSRLERQITNKHGHKAVRANETCWLPAVQCNWTTLSHDNLNLAARAVANTPGLAREMAHAERVTDPVAHASSCLRNARAHVK